MARAGVTVRSVDTKRRMTLGSALPETLEGLKSDAVHAWRHDNLGRLLLFAFHVFETRLIARSQAAGFEDLRQVHLNALRYIDDPGGTRIVDLATRAGVTKGAMGQLVEDCKRLDLVTLTVDPDDKRSKIVRFSARGRRFIAVTEKAVAEIEAEFARAMGKGRCAELRKGLTSLRAAVVAEMEGEAADEADDAEGRR